jgi:succinylglutamate desuccinylase
MKNKRKKLVIISILTHGDESIGLHIKKELEKIKIDNGILEFIIGNEMASQLNKRFIDQDLNRSFPGNSKGNHEQRIAAKLLPIIKSADLVIDIHSTTSDLKDALIITKLNKKTKEYIKVINPKYLLWMRVTKDNALISNAKIGIAFEYGSDTSKVAIDNTVRDIKNLLVHLRVINLKNKEHKKLNKTRFFEVKKTVLKLPGYILSKKVKNYKLIRAGVIYASSKEGFLKAKKDFTPILFGEKNYSDIFGFEGIERYNL